MEYNMETISTLSDIDKKVLIACVSWQKNNGLASLTLKRLSWMLNDLNDFDCLKSLIKLSQTPYEVSKTMADMQSTYISPFVPCTIEYAVADQRIKCGVIRFLGTIPLLLEPQWLFNLESENNE